MLVVIVLADASQWNSFAFTHQRIRSLAHQRLPLMNIGEEPKARQIFSQKNIEATADFDLIWWAGVNHVMVSYTKMFGIFITKQVSGWCSSNNKLSIWDDEVDNMCPNCGVDNESLKHVTHYRHKGRVTLLYNQ